MNQHSVPVLGVVARGGAGPAGDPSLAPVIDPSCLTWATDLFRGCGATGDAIVFVPDLERNPLVGRGAQLDELLPEQSPHVAVVPLHTHVTGIQAAIRDCAPQLGRRAEFIAAVRAHVAGSYAGAWLRRVGKLESPSPSFGQHLRSWSPLSRGYFATVHPSLQVRRRPTPAHSATGPLVLRTSAAPDRRLEQALRGVYGAQQAEVLGAAHRPADRWGVDRVVEYVAGPDPMTLQLPPPEGRCPTCGDPMWGQCAFCHLTAPRLDHWVSVSVPGVAPVGDAPTHLPAPSAPLPQKAFQLPRLKSKSPADHAGPPARRP